MHFHFMVAEEGGKKQLSKIQKDAISTAATSVRIEYCLLDVTWHLRQPDPLFSDQSMTLSPLWPSLSMDPPITPQSWSQLNLTPRSDISSAQRPNASE